MDEIPKLREKVLSSAPNENFGKYIWETAIKPQLGYSFSLIHSLAYSYIGIQTIYLATFFPSVYWNTACLRVDSGLDDDASSAYVKIAKAVGNMKSKGINVSPISINRSGYMFEPDEEHDAIYFGLKALTGVNGEAINTIIENRPYAGIDDFVEKTGANKTETINLIKSGAFDEFGERSSVMRQYLGTCAGTKSKLTLQNFKGLADKGLIPTDLRKQVRVFNFNKSLKSCKRGDSYVLEGVYYDFFAKFFDTSELELTDGSPSITTKQWKKLYDATMAPVKEWLATNQESILKEYNDALTQEQWDKYCGNGSYAAWEMDSMGYYYHDHELAHVNYRTYSLAPYSAMPSDPSVKKVFKKGDRQFPIFDITRICGTVVGKDIAKSTFNLLTPESGVVTVRLVRDEFARLNRRISERHLDGTSTVMEDGWFKKGTLLVVSGFRRGEVFTAKTYKSCDWPLICKVTDVDSNGIMVTQSTRYGEELD